MTVALSPAQLIRRRAVAVELERRRRKRARVSTVTDSYGEWLAVARPALNGQPVQWTAPHFLAMQAALDRVTAGTLRRWYCSIPIRHAKTEHNTIGYGAYRLERNPATRILLTSHNAGKALKFSRELKRLAESRGVEVRRDVNAAGEWETTGGGRVVAIGAGAGSAGENADLIIVDDPIGSREEAESAAERERAWDWLTNDILSRTEPHTAVLLTMSRWHDDDVAGRLLDRFGAHWEVLDLPGLAEENDPLGRAVGEPLWPEHRGIEWHEEKQRELLDYGYASLIQGRPRPREGGMFKWDWWQKIEAIPATGQMIRYWDLAGTKPKGHGHDPDYTAGALLCRTPDKRAVIANVNRFRVEVAARDALIEQQARRDREVFGPRVIYWFERQAGISGSEATDALIRRVQSCGVAAYAESVTGSKPERATPLASAAMAGNVLLAPDDRAIPWHDAFRLEAADFPNGSHDDQVDAVAGAFNKLAATTVPASNFRNPF